jgi:hypothetical protein
MVILLKAALPVRWLEIKSIPIYRMKYTNKTYVNQYPTFAELYSEAK